MAERLDILNNVINATKEQYKQSNNKECTDADELVEYASFLGGNTNFQIWDQVYDNDGVVSNNLSKSRYYASNNDLLFQNVSDAHDATSAVTLYDLNTQSMKKITDKSEIFNLLNDMNGEADDNTLTDSKSQKISKNAFLNNSKISIKLTSDGFEFVGLEPTPTPTPTPTVTPSPTITPTPTPTITPVPTVTPTPVSNTSLSSKAQCSSTKYSANNVHAFDILGKSGSEFLLLDNDEMKIITQMGTTSKSTASVITDEAIELKGSNITVVAHTNYKYEIFQTDANGNKVLIADQSGAKVSNAAKILANAGITVTFSGANLSVGYKGRTANLQLWSTNINDKTAIESGDTGLKTQVAGVYDKMTEGNQDGVITINGKTFTYDPNQQNLVQDTGHTSYNLDRTLTANGKTTTVRQAILADLAKIDTDGTVDGWITTNGTKKHVSLASAFNTSSGYTAAEFNEFIAQLLYSTDSKFF